AFIDRARQHLSGLPGVERVAAASALPLSNRGRTERIRREGADEAEALVASTTFVSGPYLETMGIATVRGRSLTEADQVAAAQAAGRQVMVVDTSVMRDVFGGEDPVGERVTFLGEPWEIVGVVEPVRHWMLDRDPLPGVYLPQAYAPGFTSVVARSELAPSALAGALRDAMAELDAHLPLANIRTLEQSVDHSLAARRATLLLLQVFAGIAVALACVGIYGVMAFSVGRRTRELSIRAALGAHRSQILGLVLGAGMRLWALGVLVGLPLALWSVGLLESRLFGVEARDPAVFGAVVVLLGVLAGVSVYLPARRAAAVDPSEALRAD
ncbi:MAG: ABC transporter permease, partial [Holophagales bacterium]|nr:ABC transporter permease [Holophagales bacterium]